MTGHKTTTVTIRENGQGTFTQDITAGAHVFHADEPVDMGGLDTAPAPYDFLLAALGACTAMTLRMYASHKKWSLDNVAVTVTHEKQDVEGVTRDIITRTVTVTGALDDTQRQRLIDIANKCPVHRTLEATPLIRTVAG